MTKDREKKDHLELQEAALGALILSRGDRLTEALPLFKDDYFTGKQRGVLRAVRELAAQGDPLKFDGPTLHIHEGA